MFSSVLFVFFCIIFGKPDKAAFTRVGVGRQRELLQHSDHLLELTEIVGTHKVFDLSMNERSVTINTL